MKLDPEWYDYRPDISDEEAEKLIAEYKAKIELHVCTATPAWIGHELLRRGE